KKNNEPGPSVEAVADEEIADESAQVPSPAAVPIPQSADIWQAMLDLLSQKSQSLASLLSDAKFGGVEAGSAILRYPYEHRDFAGMLERNGKSALVREALGQVLGQAVALRIEIDPAPEVETEHASAKTEPGPVAPDNSPNRAHRSRLSPAPEAAV